MYVVNASRGDRDVYGSPLTSVDDGGVCHPRVQVLLDTLSRLDSPEKRDAARQLALSNVARWAGERQGTQAPYVRVVKGDWGEVCLEETRKNGIIFAVLNMANARHFGGGYTTAAAAQEENMFRRTDCHYTHLRCDESVFLHGLGRVYTDKMSDLVNANDQGQVYLDTKAPRVCIRGQEIPGDAVNSYRVFPPEMVFPFYELRAAAVDLRSVQIPQGTFEKEARRRIQAQLDTLRKAQVRHVILSASGCGAFRNPAHVIARIYRQEISKRSQSFDCIVFAIYDAGYGPDNFSPFQREFS